MDINWARQKIKRQEKLNHTERRLIEIPAFFETILLYLLPHESPDFFATPLQQADITSVYPYAASRRLENTQMFIPLNSIYLMDKNTLTAYLGELKKVLLANALFSFPIILQDLSHVVFLKLHKSSSDKNVMWRYIDTNSMEKYPHNHYYAQMDDKSLATALFESLAGGEHLGVHIQGFSTTVSSKIVNDFLILNNQYIESTRVIDKHDNAGAGILHLAINSKKIEVITALLKLKPCLNEMTANGETPLNLAIARNQCDVIKLLLQQGADINQQSRAFLDVTPLMLAIMQMRNDENTDMIECLLVNNINLYLQTTSGKTALDYIIQAYYDRALLLILTYVKTNNLPLQPLISKKNWGLLMKAMNRSESFELKVYVASEWSKWFNRYSSSTPHLIERRQSCRLSFGPTNIVPFLKHGFFKPKQHNPLSYVDEARRATNVNMP